MLLLLICVGNMLVLFIKLVIKWEVGWWYNFCGVLICMILFLFIIKMVLEMVKVLFWLCVIYNEVILNCCCNLWILLCILWCRLVFRLLSGLLNNSILGFRIRVWVSVICCCCLLEIWLIKWLVNLFKFINVSVFFICLWILFFGCFSIFKL